MAEFFDTHAHLDFPEFAADRDEVIARARDAGITRILTVGTTLESSRRAVEIAEQHEGVFAVVGVHPNHVTESPLDIADPLRELARHPKAVAIGETGLDYHRLESLDATALDALKKRQRALFEQQLAVAAELGLNCVIHQRDAFEDTLEVLRGRPLPPRCVFHCFGGTPGDARRILDLGHLVSFTGIATFKNGAQVRQTIASVPLGRFMLETDCPFLAPVPHRGRRCEPAFVADIAPVAADAKGCSLKELSDATCGVAREFFPKLK